MLELRGLTRRYGDLVALDDLSFSVAEGQMFGFVGPNGAGKTTAMRIVLGVLEADAGQVFWRGSPMDEQTRRRTATCPRTTDKRLLRCSLAGRVAADLRQRRRRRSGRRPPRR